MILSIAEVVRTGVICTSAEVGTYDIGHDTGTEFKGAELLKKIEENYKFADFFELNFDDVVRKDLVPTDKAFLAWLEKYGEDKWFE